MTIFDYYGIVTMKSWLLGFIIFLTVLVTITIIVKVIKCILNKRAIRKYCNKIKHIAKENPIKTKRGSKNERKTD